MPDRRLIGAIDLGSTRYRCAVIRGDGSVLAKRDGFVDLSSGVDLVEAMLADFALVAEPYRERLIGLGASLCGAIDNETHEIHPPNLRIAWGMNFERELALGTGLRVVADNDANLGALGEQRFGAARGLHSLVYMTVSTGIGGGIIVDDRIVRGAHGLAGEIGHMMVAPGGPQCGCGNYGCLEAVASGTGIARVARLRIAAGAPSFMVTMAGGDIEAIDSALVAEAARREDPLAVDIARSTGEALARGVLSLTHTLDPELIVVGGSVMLSADVFFAPMVRAVAEDPYTPFMGKARVVLAELGDDVCLLGAAALGFDAL